MAIRSISLNGSDWLFKGYEGEDWIWRHAQEPGTLDRRQWFRGTVPGSVQNDLWKAGVIPDPYVGMNSLAIEWTPQRTWLYKKTFTVPEDLRGQRARLVFEGVDYSARYFLNGELIGQSEGLFLPAEFEVAGSLVYGGENLVAVVIDAAPPEQPQVGYTSKVWTQKPRMNYWWDFCPRMIHQGIWQDVRLEFTGPARIADVHVQSSLSDDYQAADVTVTVELDRPAESGAEIEVTVQDEDGRARQQVVTVQAAAGEKTVRAGFAINQPALWWPNGYGKQPLYAAAVRLQIDGVLSDEKQARFGIRSVTFTQNDQAPDGALPYVLTVNGRRMYINGWNWVPMDVLYGVQQPERRERLLALAKNAHVNLLRVWGGGLIEQEAFYDLCDRLGILVWQEFTQSSSGIDNVPSEAPAFIDLLVRTARQSIRARRNHPSLAIWCGGNELHASQQALVGDDHPALAALKETVQALDPGRAWLPSSPSGGEFGFGIPENEEAAQRKHDVHGPWEYQGTRKQYALYNQGTSLLHSEFGVEGITNLPALNAALPVEHQQPVSLDNPLWYHLARWWLHEKTWNDAFGTFASIEAAQRATQFLQADGLRYAVEADRRRQFHNSGTLPWQFNEPYPMAACTSAVDYFTQPKPVYYTVARAYQPLTVTARFDMLAWGGEGQFTAEVWASNAGKARDVDLMVQVFDMKGGLYKQEMVRLAVNENGSTDLWAVSEDLDKIDGDVFFLDLSLNDPVSAETLAVNRYVFTKAADLSPLLHQPRAEVQAGVKKDGDVWTIRLTNLTHTAALFVQLDQEKGDLRATGGAYFSDSYACLLVNEQREVQVRWLGVPEGERAVRVSGWNFDPLVIR